MRPTRALRLLPGMVLYFLQEKEGLSKGEASPPGLQGSLLQINLVQL